MNPPSSRAASLALRSALGAHPAHPRGEQPRGASSRRRVVAPKLPKLAPCRASPATDWRLVCSRLKYLLKIGKRATVIKGCKAVRELRLRARCREREQIMDDPLFKAGDLMLRASTLVPDASFDKYNEAMEKWNNKADAGNVMAYVSSWGEANPGGGQDQILKYLKKSKTDVEESVALLKTIIELVGVKV